jgi:hypothetical protein
VQSQLPLIEAALRAAHLQVRDIELTGEGDLHDYVESRRLEIDAWEAIPEECRAWVFSHLDRSEVPEPRASSPSASRTLILSLRASNDDPVYDALHYLFGTRDRGDDYGYTHGLHLRAGIELLPMKNLMLYFDASTRLYNQELSAADENTFCTQVFGVAGVEDCLTNRRIQYFANHNRVEAGVGRMPEEGLFWAVFTGVDHLDSTETERFYSGARQQILLHHAAGLREVSNIGNRYPTRNGAYFRVEVGARGALAETPSHRLRLEGWVRARAEGSTLRTGEVAGDGRLIATAQGRRGRGGIRFEVGAGGVIHQDGIETTARLGGTVFMGPFYAQYSADLFIDSLTTGLNQVSGLNLMNRDSGRPDTINAFTLGVTVPVGRGATPRSNLGGTRPDETPVER